MGHEEAALMMALETPTMALETELVFLSAEERHNRADKLYSHSHRMLHRMLRSIQC